jgi:hypothetical protein
MILANTISKEIRSVGIICQNFGYIQFEPGHQISIVVK